MEVIVNERRNKISMNTYQSACLKAQQVHDGARHIGESRVLQVTPELGLLGQPGAANCHWHLPRHIQALSVVRPKFFQQTAQKGRLPMLRHIPERPQHLSSA